MSISNGVPLYLVTKKFLGFSGTFQHPRSIFPGIAAGNIMAYCNAVALTVLQQPFNGLFSRTTWVSRYQKGKTYLDFTGARDSEWQWHQLGRMQVCTSLQTDSHASTPPLCFSQAGCPSCHPTNSIKALKALALTVVGPMLHFSTTEHTAPTQTTHNN